MLGFSGLLLIGLYIQYELSWGKVHEKDDRIYRVQRYMGNVTTAQGGKMISYHTYVCTGTMLEEFPEFELVSTIREGVGNYFSLDKENLVYDNKGIYADHNFLSIFTCDFIEGEQTNALVEPFSIVLAKSLADKLFP